MCLRGRKRGISIMTITKDMSIGEVVQKYPATVEVFLRHGLMCFGCAVARFESIEQGALAHGMDVDALLRDLNAAVSEEPETAAPAGR
jgi:hybrid cluster-associated redox disulfide protein